MDISTEIKQIEEIPKEIQEVEIEKKPKTFRELGVCEEIA
jgi:hypothetical protein